VCLEQALGRYASQPDGEEGGDERNYWKTWREKYHGYSRLNTVAGKDRDPVFVLLRMHQTMTERAIGCCTRVGILLYRILFRRRLLILSRRQSNSPSHPILEFSHSPPIWSNSPNAWENIHYSVYAVERGSFNPFFIIDDQWEITGILSGVIGNTHLGQTTDGTILCIWVHTRAELRRKYYDWAIYANVTVKVTSSKLTMSWVRITLRNYTSRHKFGNRVSGSLSQRLLRLKYIGSISMVFASVSVW
jgi:hypothetical protein